MNIKKDTCQQDSDTAPVSFTDVAACFSEQEWKLLHDWQTELYEHVMNEIHQAVASLGPLIATSVFSLRPKGKGYLFPLDYQDSEISGNVNCFPRETISHSDVFRKKREPNQYGKHIQDTNQREIRYCPSPAQTELIPNLGSAAGAPVSSFGDKDEGETYSMDQQDSGSWGGNCSPTAERAVNTPVVPFKIKEETCFINYQDSETQESTHSPTEHEDITQILSFIIKEDGKTYSMDHQDSEIKGRVNTCGGKRPRKRREMDSVKRIENAAPGKAALGKAKAKKLQRSETGSSWSRQLGSHSSQEQMVEKTILCDIGFTEESRSGLHKVAVKAVKSETYCDQESNMRNAEFVTCPESTSENGGQYTSTEGEQHFSNTGGGTEDQGSHAALRDSNPKQNTPPPYSEYENIFSQMTNRIGHQRSNTAQRQYTCNKCDKSFSQMRSRNRHQSTHSKERPYQCSECEKSFNRKDNLTRHQRSHAADFQAQQDMLSTTAASSRFQS